ncbi:LysM-like peptidoglycan binding protein [Gordonia phage Kabocha]|uniref:LysM domain-containing protein n=1 Tax=Gordonia phage Chidiebere TaxID=2656530 RepID=A0A649VL06_9CAUD|nr:hypothetical protein PQD14_gp050 [Gordonia phage Chidiebere]AZS07904.1 hypothetical protein PBI_GRAY_50 [Gordonia phage Gray]WAA19837.1 LysM-like peptidoglycan binding protein [Gordonia phage Kabocha]WAA20027.1 LysM-like peptidoglycan binding protein [Gordonia phage Hanem]WNM67070.1 minor tail protein [Gordonia Phage Schomber]QGJ92941.1 hypothetical protein PBI_CHIDIEBERE_50 [Gordonia phage Chidiebere]
MATVQIVVPKYDARTGRPKMIIMGSNNDMFEVPWAPREVQHSDLGEDVSEIERAGRVPDIAVKSPKLRKMSFSFVLGRSLNTSCEPEIDRIRAIVNTGGWIQILYGPQESGLWKCTNIAIATVEREPVSNQISRATVDMEFVEVPDSRKTVAKYSNDFNFRDDAVTASISQSIVDLAKTVRARNNAGNSGNPSGGITVGTNGAVTIPPHIVQAGETLLSIAQKYYGEYGEQFWRLIGDYNKVIGSLNIGQMLRIP